MDINLVFLGFTSRSTFLQKSDKVTIFIFWYKLYYPPRIRPRIINMDPKLNFSAFSFSWAFIVVC